MTGSQGISRRQVLTIAAGAAGAPVIGTFRTLRDVRVESIVRSTADIGGAFVAIEKRARRLGRAKFREEERSKGGTPFQTSNDSVALA